MMLYKSMHKIKLILSILVALSGLLLVVFAYSSINYQLASGYSDIHLHIDGPSYSNEVIAKYIGGNIRFLLIMCIVGTALLTVGILTGVATVIKRRPHKKPSTHTD